MVYTSWFAFSNPRHFYHEASNWDCYGQRTAYDHDAEVASIVAQIAKK